MSPASRTRMLRTISCAATLTATIVVIAGAGCGLGLAVAYGTGVYGDYAGGVHRHDGARVLRDGDHWGRYTREPQALHQRRMQAPPKGAPHVPCRTVTAAGDVRGQTVRAIVERELRADVHGVVARLAILG